MEPKCVFQVERDKHVEVDIGISGQEKIEIEITPGFEFDW